MKNIFLKYLGIFCICVWGHVAIASPSEEELFFENLKTQTLSILKAENVSKHDKQNRIKAMLLEYTAIYQIGRSVLGQPWRQITKQQQDAYIEVFSNWMSSTLAKRLVSFELQGDMKTLQKYKGKNGILVISTLVETKTQGKVPVDWYVRKIGNSPKLINVSIANVSMITTQRSEFSVIYSKKGLSGLLQNMQLQLSEQGLK